MDGARSWTSQTYFRLDMIPVIKPFLPPISEYMAQVQRAYDNEWLTNRGELVLELEVKLQNYLNSSAKPILMNNGTIPLQIALKLLGAGGEIITTPFSYVATTSTIVWEGCTPVFVDINAEKWTIDETKIEESITSKTTCILATHVFGNPCNVEEIERIAKKYGLYVIYDAAHCFGVNYKGKSIFDWGDISTCSFHATKIFHTGEGGAAFVNNKNIWDKVFYSHNFGHNGPTDFHGVGVNGKMSELQAAMGLSVLPYMGEILEIRKQNYLKYESNLSDKFDFISIREETTWNYSYCQLVSKEIGEVEKIIDYLMKFEIGIRRYFYPSLNNLKYVSQIKMENSDILAQNIFTLPNFFNLSNEEIMNIIGKINNFKLYK
jgi:dTDP-4-amino-4,6-dideoxygalactose transaminase